MKQYFIRHKSKNKFNLDKKDVVLGSNKITISKKLSFKKPLIKLMSNNLKTVLDYEKLTDNQLLVKFNLDSKREYKLIVQDGLKKQTFELNFTSKIINEKKFDFEISEYYKKGKIFMQLSRDESLPYDFELSLEGDLEKKVIWKKDTKVLNVNFVHQVIGYKTLRFNINGKRYVKTIINDTLFPSSLIKTNNGVKLNKYPQYDLVLKTNLGEEIFKAGNPLIVIDLSKVEYLKLFFRDKLLFEQKLTKEKFQPKVTLTSKPLGIKLSQPYYEDVAIKIKGIEKKFIITQGNTWVEIPSKKGLRKIVIESVSNASIDKNEFTILISK